MGKNCLLHLELLMGKSYVTIPMSHSWERMSLTPWVAHGKELRAFIACKMPRSMHNMPYIGKELRQSPQKDIPVTQLIMDYESHLDFLRRHQRGTLFLLQF